MHHHATNKFSSFMSPKSVSPDSTGPDKTLQMTIFYDIIDLCAKAYYRPPISDQTPKPIFPPDTCSDLIFICSICRKNPVCLLLEPCSHICACSECLSKLKGTKSCKHCRLKRQLKMPNLQIKCK